MPHASMHVSRGSVQLIEDELRSIFMNVCRMKAVESKPEDHINKKLLDEKQFGLKIQPRTKELIACWLRDCFRNLVVKSYALDFLFFYI